MLSNGIPAWSPSASESIGLLYRDLQPLEVYVEDSNSEPFYLELLNRMLSGGQSIKKVVPLHGRSHVLKSCSDYQGDFPAIFLIDGDLNMFFGEREKGYKNLFQLKAYCIENYLFCSDAARELIVEGSGLLRRQDALSAKEWNDHFKPVHSELKELFITFAAARKAKPDLKTVAHGAASVVTNSRRKGPQFDFEKVSNLRHSIVEECSKEVGRKEWEEIVKEVRLTVADLNSIDLVSGKDFLLPLMAFFIRSKVEGSMTNHSLMFKLAKYCSLQRLEDLKVALLSVLAGNVFISG
ncbi:DUF4435 domain-containing protein [Pseudomonas monteilii]